jgi:hypothetical protein
VAKARRRIGEDRPPPPHDFHQPSSGDRS